MGPNGSGKSTLGSTLLGSPEYEVTAGTITFRGDDVTDWPTDERAKAGMFLAFQYPQEIAGVSVIQFLRQALSARKGIDLSVLELRLATMDWMKRLGMDSSFVDRYLNEGFSGGEKKRNEIMQMAILEPELAILDETDSGLDIDALRVVAQGIREVRADRPSMGVVMITHYQRLLDEVKPDHIHILVDGRIVASGGMELAEQLERDGYEPSGDGRRRAGGSTVTELSTMTLDVATIRKEFPILDREIDGAPIVYLDSGNTSQKPRQVIDAMLDFLETVVRADQPQLLPPRRRGHRRLRARPPVGRPLHQRAERRRGRVHQERHRVDQPRRPDWGRPNLQRRRRRRPHRDGAPRQHRALAHAGGRARHRDPLDAPHRRRPTRHDRPRPAARRRQGVRRSRR